MRFQIAGRTVREADRPPAQARYSGLPLGVGRLQASPTASSCQGTCGRPSRRGAPRCWPRCPAEMGGMFDALARLGRQQSRRVRSVLRFLRGVALRADDVVRGLWSREEGDASKSPSFSALPPAPPAQLVPSRYQEKAVPVPRPAGAALLQRVRRGPPENSGPWSRTPACRELGAAHSLDACREVPGPREIAGQHTTSSAGDGCPELTVPRGPPLCPAAPEGPPALRPLPKRLTASATPRRSGEQHLQREQGQPPLPHVVVKVTDHPLPARVDLDRARQGEDLGFQVGQTGKTDKSAKRVGPRNARNISLQLRSRRIHRGPGFALDCCDNGLVCDGQPGEFGQ